MVFKFQNVEISKRVEIGLAHEKPLSCFLCLKYPIYEEIIGRIYFNSALWENVGALNQRGEETS